MIVKVKEPIQEEYGLIKPDQVVFTYFHFASSETLTTAMIKVNQFVLLMKLLKMQMGRCHFNSNV